MTQTTPRNAPPGPTTGSSPVLLGAGGLVAGFALASCCALPLLLGGLGIGSAWLFRFAVLAAPHRTFVLIAGVVTLGAAAVVLWRQRSLECAPGAVCTRPLVRRATIVTLILSALLLVAGYAYT